MILDEPITIEPYNPAWPTQFAQEREVLCRSLSVEPSRVEHIGSTAVPGLSAKPIVDILLGLECFPPRPSVTDRLQANGYEAFGEAGVPERYYFRRRLTVAFNVQAVLFGGSLWHDNLLLRSYLRSHPTEARRYADAKQSAFAAGYTMLLSYSTAKAATIAQFLAAARQVA